MIYVKNKCLKNWRKDTKITRRKEPVVKLKTSDKMEWDLQTFDLEYGVLGNDVVANQIDQNIINLSCHYDKPKVPIVDNSAEARDYGLSNDVEGEIFLSDGLNLSCSVQRTDSYSCDTPNKKEWDLQTFDLEHIFSGNNEVAIEINQNIINFNLHNEKPKQTIVDNSEELRDYSLSNDVEGDIFLNDDFNLSGSVQKTNPYSCDTCQKCFKTKVSLRRPTRKHTGEKPHKCTICETQQPSSKQTGKKPYQCNICKMCFSLKSSLSRHIRIHTGEKPYQCTICDKRFNQSSTLSKHIRIHTGKKPYQCNICKKYFRSKFNLSTHIRIHTGEKPYQCTICEKRFNRRSNLSTHIRIHTGEKPYQCTICEKRFNQSSLLSQHMRQHTLLVSKLISVTHNIQ